jgi:hypothetical protein
MAATVELVLYPMADFTAVIGDDFQCLADAVDASDGVATDAIVFTSSNTAVATIDSATGIWHSLTEGTTTITATAGGVSTHRTMTVVAETPGVPIQASVTRAFQQARIAALISPGPVHSVDADYAVNLQNAINAAAASGSGWTLTLTETTNYGPINLPKNNTGALITVVKQGVRPPRGTRATQVVAAAYNFPKIWTNNSGNGAIMVTTPRVSNYRFIGIDIGYNPSDTVQVPYGMIECGQGINGRLSGYSQNIGADHCFVRGSPGAFNARVGFAAEGAWHWAIDCDTTEFHYNNSGTPGYPNDVNSDSQGLRLVIGPGEFYGENCGWQSAHETVATGGGGSSTVVGVGTVSCTSGVVTFSTSQAGIIRPGMRIVQAWSGTGPVINYTVQTFDGNMSGTLSPGDGNPTFGPLSSWSVNQLPNMLIRDLRLYHCYLNRPLAWKGVYSCKNMFESKQSLFTEFEDCVYSHCYQDQQNGECLMLWGGNQSTTDFFMCTRDFYMNGGVVEDVASLLQTADSFNGHPSNNLHRISIVNVLVRGFDTHPDCVSPDGANANGRGVVFVNSINPNHESPRNMTFRHVTFPVPNYMPFQPPGVGEHQTYKGFVVEDSIIVGSSLGYATFASNDANGVAAWNGFVDAPTSRCRNNVLIDTSGAGEPSTGANTNNAVVSSFADVFTTPASAFSLSAPFSDLAVPVGVTNHYRGTNAGGSFTTTDGADPGADMVRIASFYANVVSGDFNGVGGGGFPPPTVTPTLQPQGALLMVA